MSKRSITNEYVVELPVSIGAAQQAALAAGLGYLDAGFTKRDGTTWIRLHVLAVSHEEAESYARWRLDRHGVTRLVRPEPSVAVAS
jgi:hypothetical protein